MKVLYSYNLPWAKKSDLKKTKNQKKQKRDVVTM